MRLPDKNAAVVIPMACMAWIEGMLFDIASDHTVLLQLSFTFQVNTTS